MKFTKSRILQQRIHQVIPGGCHTYGKGDDQFPELAPGFMVRGKGSHVWDADGNEFIEFGAGCRAVTLGHAYPAVLEAVQKELQFGVNFTRPAPIELECAEEFLSMVPAVEMVKFSKEGSSATNAALRLARAYTGRDRVALCADHPFFSIHDWFIGTTEIDTGIPQAVKELSLGYRYNDPESLERLFAKYPEQIACVILEPEKNDAPKDDFLHRVRELCDRHGALLILDEMITGFRWHNGGAQTLYGVEPDLSTFGKGIANGFALSALAGKREYMELGGLYHDRQRVFLLSTTHGAETHGMAAGISVMRTYQELPVVETLHTQGQKLSAGIRAKIRQHGLDEFVQIVGRPCNLIFVAKDRERQPSQPLRTLLMQELIRNGIIGPSLVVNYSHTDADIAHAVSAFDSALGVYAEALNSDVRPFLVGRETQSVYRRSNARGFAVPPKMQNECSPSTVENDPSDNGVPIGNAMHALAQRLYPLHRSWTGSGVRQTLQELIRFGVPLETREVPTGTEVFDWTIPQEWSIRDAFIKDASGKRLVDYRKSNLHVVNGSVPIDAKMNLQQLQSHLHQSSLMPDHIPYRTCFLRNEWGFSIDRSIRQELEKRSDQEFHVVIDSEFNDGSLTYGECYLPGEVDDEVLFFTHVCHPSLANDNLSGIVVSSQLAKCLLEKKPHLSYRFVFAPTTLGSISWLHRNQARVGRIRAGLVLTLLGNRASLTYKRTRQANATIDRVVQGLLTDHDPHAEVRDFSPIGYDERQFCSPGFDLPIGCLMRTPFGEFREYHTSADDLSFIQPEMLDDALQFLLQVTEQLDWNRTFMRRDVFCEPQLGKHDIYRAYGQSDDRGRFQEAVMWLLNQADGSRDLHQISERSGLPFRWLQRAASRLLELDLITSTANGKVR